MPIKRPISTNSNIVARRAGHWSEVFRALRGARMGPNPLMQQERRAPENAPGATNWKLRRRPAGLQWQARTHPLVPAIRGAIPLNMHHEDERVGRTPSGFRQKSKDTAETRAESRQRRHSPAGGSKTASHNQRRRACRRAHCHSTALLSMQGPYQPNPT